MGRTATYFFLLKSGLTIRFTHPELRQGVPNAEFEGIPASLCAFMVHAPTGILVRPVPILAVRNAEMIFIPGIIHTLRIRPKGQSRGGQNPDSCENDRRTHENHFCLHNSPPVVFVRFDRIYTQDAKQVTKEMSVMEAGRRYAR